MAKKQLDPTICSAPSCSMYKWPGSEYCFHHKSMYPSKKTKEVKAVDKYNPQGFKSQVELFKHIWEDRIHTCYVTGEDLDKYNTPVHFLSIFAHVLSKAKAKHPEFKLYSNNLVMVTPRVHELFDKGSLDQILKFERENACSFVILFELEADLLKEYRAGFRGKKVVGRSIVERYFKATR